MYDAAYEIYGEMSAYPSLHLLELDMQVVDLKKSLDEWGLIIKRTSKFSDTDRGVYKKLVEFCNSLQLVGIDDVPENKYVEIAQRSALNFRETPPPIEDDKENPQLYRIDILNYLANNRKIIFDPGHRLYKAFESYILLLNEYENESKFSDSPTDDNQALRIREKQLQDDLYLFLTNEVGYSVGTMTRTVFDDIVENEWKNYVNIVRESLNALSQKAYVEHILKTPANAGELNEALKEINWRTAKDGMLSVARCYNVLKTLQGNHSDDCFWVMYGPEGGEGKSVYTNGELKHFTRKHLSVYVGDNKCFGEHFNSPEPFQAKLLYVREDESWSPEQIRFKKQLVDHDFIGIEQKGKDAYRITPQCLVTSMTNYRSYDISRRFAIIDYGRNRIGVDVKSLKDSESIEKFSNVSERIYDNLFANKDEEYVDKVCTMICKSVQFLNKREDKSWAFNVAVKMIQNMILDKDPDLMNLDSPDYCLTRVLLTKSLNKYKKIQDESKIMSNEFYKNNVYSALVTLIESKELSEDIFIGTTNDYNKLIGKWESDQKHEAVVIKNKRNVYAAIEKYFKRNTRPVNNKEEEKIFERYLRFFHRIVNNGEILNMDMAQVASILECKYSLPE